MRSNPVRYAPVFAVLAVASCNNFLNEWAQKAAVNPVSPAAPVISQGPQGAEYNRNAAAAPLTVEVENGAQIAEAGGILSYQWYTNSANPNAEGTPIPDATGASYTPPTDETGIRYYYVKITNTVEDNGAGGAKTAAALSNTAAIVVNNKIDALPPVISGYPQGAEYRLNETPAALTVTAQPLDGGSLSYQWYKNSVNSNAGGTPIPDATGASYTPPTSTAGTVYCYVKITNTIADNGDGGVKSATTVSNTAQVTVKGVFTGGSITLEIVEGYTIQGSLTPEPDYYDIYYRMGEHTVPDGLDFTGWTRIPGAKEGRVATEYAGLPADPGGYGYSMAAAARKNGYDESTVSNVIRLFHTNLIDLAALPPNENIRGSGWVKSSEQLSLSITSGANVTIKGDGGEYPYEVTVYDSSEGSVPETTITLDGVNLCPLGMYASPLNIDQAKVTLKLAGSSTLTAVGNAAIYVGNRAELTIEGTGSLTAEGGSSTAGIRIGSGYDGGTITIKGGTVNARGGENGAGIGGGNGEGGGNITISGGTVNAKGGESGAGIGGGGGGAGGTITISGGTVNAQGGENGAGIGGGNGGGYSGDGGEITISGGTVIALGGAHGAGIGGGHTGAGGEITMRGGTVIALGSQNGMGIGNGDGGSTGTFAISSGSPIIFTPSIAPGSSPWPPGIAIVDIIDITPGTFPVLFNSITVRLQENFTVPSGAALTIPFNMTLDLYGHTLTNQGTVNNQGRVELNGGQVDPASTGTWNENPPQ